MDDHDGDAERQRHDRDVVYSMNAEEYDILTVIGMRQPL